MNRICRDLTYIMKPIWQYRVYDKMESLSVNSLHDPEQVYLKKINSFTLTAQSNVAKLKLEIRLDTKEETWYTLKERLNHY